MPMRPAPRSPIPALFFTAAALALIPAVAGCSIPQEEEGFASTNPQARAKAVGTAMADEDRAAIPQLITMLGSDDPAHRMLAIRALEQMTGETFGFRHADPEPDRELAIEDWVAWWEEVRQSPAGPVSVAPSPSAADHVGAGAASGPSSGPRPADQER